MITYNFSSKLGLLKPIFSEISGHGVLIVQTAGLKYYMPKEPIDSSEWPENRKLRSLDKTPNYGSTKPPRMPKMIRLMRGPEEVHTDLIYGGYGIKALLGGRLKFEHLEFIRFRVNKKLDQERMFAVWRIAAPWQPLSKKGTGKRMGGGKGSIHHYCTPVKADRIIIELGGDLHELEARAILAPVASVLPFPARVVSQKEIEAEREEMRLMHENNTNPFSMEYIIRNNMGGCSRWLSRSDYKWFGWYK